MQKKMFFVVFIFVVFAIFSAQTAFAAWDYCEPCDEWKMFETFCDGYSSSPWLDACYDFPCCCDRFVDAYYSRYACMQYWHVKSWDLHAHRIWHDWCDEDDVNLPCEP